MKITEKRITPAREDVYQIGVRCDLCKREFQGRKWGKTSCYEVFETTVEFREGTSYPEGGCAERIEFDICPECFAQRLIPMLEKMGATPSVIEEDY